MKCNLPGVPIKTPLFTKHETITFCSIAEILFDSERVCINVNFNTLASPICKRFFEIRKSKDKNVVFQELILGDFRCVHFAHLLT